MVLGFTQKFAKGPLKGWVTNFKPKILAGTKIHSMRKDVHNRWRVGMSMQLAHGVRTKVYDHFSTQVCKRIQLVTFVYAGGRKEPKVYIDGRELGIMEQIMLAINDGFDSFAQFLAYFNENGEIKLLHWTDFVYDGRIEHIQAINDKLTEFYESFPQRSEYIKPEDIPGMVEGVDAIFAQFHDRESEEQFNARVQNIIDTKNNPQ